MLGNLWEWVHDNYQEQLPLSDSTAPTVDPWGTPEPGNTKARRGGSWMSVREYCRAANRGNCILVPTGTEPADECISGSPATGFRLARTRKPDR